MTERHPSQAHSGHHHSGRRRRRQRRTKRAQRILFGSIVLCAMALLAWPLAVYMGWTRFKPPVMGGEPAKSAELVLAEAVFTGEGVARHIAGKVRNESSRRYEEVQLLFSLHDGAGKFLGTAPAKVPAVDPGRLAVFETGPIPETATRLRLWDVNGTAR